jgi:hypothetical protein
VSRILGCLTFLGLVTVILAIVLRFKEVAYPTPIILLTVGSGCFLLAGSIWAHTPGSMKAKAAVLGLVCFVFGAVMGFFMGEALTPKRPDDMSPLIMAFVGMWIGGILFAFAGVNRVRQYHRQHFVERSAAPDGRQG